MKINPTISIFICFSLFGCDISPNKHFDVIDKDANGRISIIDHSAGQMLVVNKSNRIEDVISLNLSNREVEDIRSEKNRQDMALKIKEWPEYKFPNTKYKVQLSTRYYKDRLLYRVVFSPSDTTSSMKARTILINLRDENGFVLERFDPSNNWVTQIDEKAKPNNEQSNGEIPMTLDNYMEISGYDPAWRF